MRRDGHISEEVYDRLGFSADSNYAGDIVPKPDEISQEMRHRAKILSHSLQCGLRQRRINNGFLAEKKKKDDNAIIQNEIHDRCNIGIEKLFPD